MSLDDESLLVDSVDGAMHHLHLSGHWLLEGPCDDSGR